MKRRQKNRRRSGDASSVIAGPSEPGPAAWRDRRWYGVLAVLVVIAHGISITSGFVWDDTHFVEVWLPRFDSITSLFVPPRDIPDWPTAYYRPIGVLSLKIDQILWGASATGWHITNLVVHAIVSMQVFAMLKALLAPFERGILFAGLAASLFAVHPIHVESVNWIAGRSDPLATAMSMAVIASSIQFSQDGRWLWLTSLSTFLILGLLCKEIAIVAPVLALIFVASTRFLDSPSTSHHGSKPNQEPATVPIRRFLAIGISSIIATLAFVLLRSNAVPPSQTMDSLPRFTLALESVQAGAFYLQQLFLIHKQAPVPPFTVVPSLAVSLAILLSLLGFAGFAIARFKRESTPLVVGLTWMLLSIAPSLMVVLLQTDRNTLSERYLYLPSVGFVLCIAWVASTIDRRLGGITIPVVFCICISLCALKSNLYGSYWHSDLSLWSHTTKHYPKHPRGWTILAKEYDRLGMQEERLVAVKNAVDADPEWDKTLLNMAIAMRENGRVGEALWAAQRAIEVSANNDGAWLEYGNALEMMNKNEAAREAFAEVLRINPRNAKAYVNLAGFHGGEPEIAIKLLNKAIEIDPKLPMAFNNLGVVYGNQNEIVKARECFREALRLEPDMSLANKNLRAIESD